MSTLDTEDRVELAELPADISALVERIKAEFEGTLAGMPSMQSCMGL